MSGREREEVKEGMGRGMLSSFTLSEIHDLSQEVTLSDLGLHKSSLVAVLTIDQQK